MLTSAYPALTCSSENTKLWLNAALLLAHRLQLWPSIKTIADGALHACWEVLQHLIHHDVKQGVMLDPV